MERFAVDGNHHLWLKQLVEFGQFPLTGMAGDMHKPVPVSDDLDARLGQIVDDGAHFLLVARNGAGREDHHIALRQGNVAVLACRNAGKGGADFDPKGKSDAEVMRFCQAFMSELYRHIGADVDVPAGDIGVGAREIGFLFGQYKRLSNQFTSVLTGKGPSYGGSLIRPEATGFGCVYFAEEMLKRSGQTVEGKRVAISGSGNVAQYAARKVMDLGGKVISLSDSEGTLYCESGLTEEQWLAVLELKNVQRGRISELAARFGLEFKAGAHPWSLPCDIALPCATQNELDAEAARTLLRNGCICVAEGANMPTTLDAVDLFIEAGILFAPGKASNAGGVAVSGLEMSQNAMRLLWTGGEVDSKLHAIMQSIHHACVHYGEENGRVNYVKGANIAGFVKVADAMLAQGVV